MLEYSLTTGFPAEYLVAEKESKTTYENMLFSKQILTEHGLEDQRGVFATSDYHVFRAAQYAREVNLRVDGIGARTRLYFVFNALLREYVAILAHHKKAHACVIALLMLGAIGWSLYTGNQTNWR